MFYWSMNEYPKTCIDFSFQDMEGIKLDDVDTSDVQLDDEDLLED